MTFWERCQPAGSRGRLGLATHHLLPIPLTLMRWADLVIPFMTTGTTPTVRRVAEEDEYTLTEDEEAQQDMGLEDCIEDFSEGKYVAPGRVTCWHEQCPIPPLGQFRRPSMAPLQ